MSYFLVVYDRPAGSLRELREYAPGGRATATRSATGWRRARRTTSRWSCFKRPPGPTSRRRTVGIFGRLSSLQPGGNDSSASQHKTPHDRRTPSPRTPPRSCTRRPAWARRAAAESPAYVPYIMPSNELRAELYGWWRITETSQWVNDGLDNLGPALISIPDRGTGSGCTACWPTST